MAAELNYANIIAAGQQLVPDLRQQLMQDRQIKLQEQQAAVQQQVAQQKQAQFQRQQAFQQRLATATSTGSPAAIRQLLLEYPEFADQLKPGWESLQADERKRNLTQVGSAYTRAQNGDFKGAASIIQQRYDADVAAGQADETTKEILDALNSGDPAQQQQAGALLGMLIASNDPEKFSETYKALNPTDAKTTIEKEHAWRVGQFGKAAADDWLAVQDAKIVTVNPGGSAYNAADLIRPTGVQGIVATPQQQVETAALEARFPNAPRSGAEAKGGGQAISATGSAIENAALAAVPGLTVTSRQRSPSKNASVGGVSGSYHLTDQARDFVPPKGMSFGMLAKRLKDALPGFDVINEKDHVHVEPGPGVARRNATQGASRIRSKQEYDRLPAGAQYIAPDGSLRVKG